MSFISFSLVGQHFIIHLIFIFSFLALLFEVFTGGFLFGFLALVGFVFIFNSAYVSWLSIIIVIIGILFILLEVFYPSRAIFFITGHCFLFLSFFFQEGQVNSLSDVWVLSLSLLTLCFVVFLFYLSMRKIQSLKKSPEIFSLITKQGIVLSNIGYAQIDGVMWKIQSYELLESGNTIVVLEQDGLLLTVKKVV